MAAENKTPEKLKLIDRLDQHLRNWPINRKLAVPQIAIVLSFVFILVFIMINARNIYLSFDKQLNDTNQVIRLLSDLHTNIHAILGEAREYARLGEDDTLEEIEESISAVNTSLAELMDIGGEFEAEDEAEILDELQTKISPYITKVEQVIALVQADSDPEVIENALDELEEPETEIIALIEETDEKIQNESQKIIDSITNRITVVIALIASGIFFILVVSLSLNYLVSRSIVNPIWELRAAALRIVGGEMDLIASEEGKDEISTLARTFNQMNVQQRQLIDSQTDTAERLQVLLEQTQASTQITQAVVSILDPEELIHTVVNRLQEAFNFYYVGLFLTDDLNQWAVLHTGTGEAGQAMLDREHRIKIGEGMIGWCIANAQARVALEAEEDAVRLATEELPETKSEAALPLRSRGRVLGAFTVQDDKPGAFPQETLAVLQNLADQVAIALDNAQLYAESQAALDASRRAFGEISQEAWNQYLEMQADIDYLATPQSVQRVRADQWIPEMSETYTVGQITRQGEDTIHIPIILRDQTLGVVRLRKREGAGSWSNDEIELMNTLVDQLENALETARLYSSTQLQAERERITHEVTNKLHRALDMDSLMQTLLEEIFTAMDASSAFVQLSTPTSSSESALGQTFSQND